MNCRAMHGFFQFRFVRLLFFSVVFFIFSVSVFAAAPQPADNFSFLVFGDNRDGDEVYLELINKVNTEENIAFVVHVGDFVALGKASEYKQYLKLEAGLKHKVYHVMGNHDAVYGGWQRFNQYFGNAAYSFDYQNSHFIVVDNSFDRRLTAAQLDWLQKDLSATPAKNIFVFLHRPLF
ncbi:MAG: metallophosphoesterase, partial [Candidatus Margulisiibacteriota bacterium]